MRSLCLGCIADDFTGATDLANNLVRAGMRVVQTIGVPPRPLDADVDAVVVALKSRTVPAADAVAMSLAALRWLQAQGAQQIYFKICSTFDSTPQGNIGPVTDALMDALGCDFAAVTPAFPDNQRAVFKGHLFVGDVLLSDSGMRHHPLTPMHDANLVRVLQAQTRRKVGLVDMGVVSRGAAAISERFQQLRRDGVGMAIVDAIRNDDLVQLGAALKGQPLVTAGSGVAIGLPANWGLAPSADAAALAPAGGLRAIVSGSCSVATNGQVQHARSVGLPVFSVDALQVDAGVDVAGQALAWARARLADNPGRPVLVAATTEPAELKAVQDRLGAAHAGEIVERCLADIARGLVQAGVGQLVVAGGETSGAVVQALGITQLQIGAQIDPGVPWCAANLPAQTPHGAARTLHITLKSGNFGSADFFTKAFAALG
jgi:3-dehydrotetronate 4-kinase